MKLRAAQMKSALPNEVRLAAKFCENLIFRSIAMKEDKLGELSMKLSVDILKLVSELRSKHETIITDCILENR